MTVAVSGNVPVLICAGDVTWLAVAPRAQSCCGVGHGGGTARAAAAPDAATEAAETPARKTRTALMTASSNDVWPPHGESTRGSPCGQDCAEPPAVLARPLGAGAL